MFGKSKLQNAKQKISKLKEKYFNNSNLNKDYDFTSDRPPSTVLVDNNKPEKDQSNFCVLNEPNSTVQELTSPRIEITNLFYDTEHINKGAKINSQTLSNDQNLTDRPNHDSRLSNCSPSEQSYCSKNTSKTLKTESIVLSDLSNQFEHICFLSSSSDEENTAAFHPPSLGFPQTIGNLDNSSLDLTQTSVQSFYRRSEIKQNNDVPLGKIEGSSSELSEVQSDVNSIVFSATEVESVKVYSTPVHFQSNNSEADVLKKKENKYSEDSGNSYKTLSDKKQTSISDPKFELNSSSWTQEEEKCTESSEELLKEIKPLQKSLTKQNLHKNYKTADLINISNLKLNTKTKKFNRTGRKFKDDEGDITYSSDVDRSTTVSNNSRLVNEGDSSSHKKSRHKYTGQSRHKYTEKSRTVLKHSTNLKPSTSRPILKSCVLITHDESTEENKFLHTKRMSLSQLDGNFILFFKTKCLIYQ